MNNQIKLLSLILLLVVFAFSCKRNNTIQTDECDTINTAFKQLYTTLIASGNYTDLVTYDSEVHEYSFQLNTNAKICSFGYQSQAAISTVNYKIQLIDDIGSIIYSGNHIFSATSTSYVSVPDIQIYANRTYTLRRIQTDYSLGGQPITLTIGRMLRNNGTNQIPFPVTYGSIKIISSNFYQNAGTAPNFGIPFIDFSYHQ